MHIRLESEMNDTKQQMDKEYETLKANSEAQLKAMDQRHERDREALRRTGVAEEAKMQRGLQPKHDAEMRQQQLHLKKEYGRIKETFRKVSCDVLVEVANGSVIFCLHKLKLIASVGYLQTVTDPNSSPVPKHNHIRNPGRNLYCMLFSVRLDWR